MTSYLLGFGIHKYCLCFPRTPATGILGGKRLCRVLGMQAAKVEGKLRGRRVPTRLSWAHPQPTRTTCSPA